ncbi:MAG: YbhB/YbcL family Raf kinase inhibitor-like protein [Candidatus Omnitrophota bacterium]
MKKIFLALFLTLIATPCFAEDFAVTSASWQDGAMMERQYVFNSFGCTGENTSPQVSWRNAPEGTKSFAVTVYDPDAPTGSGWWHWTIFNIPTDVSDLNEGASASGALPASAVQGKTDFGTAQYGGACPPSGDKPHRYILTVYALGIDKLDLTSDASGAMVGYYLNANALGKASLIVNYGR